MLSAKSRLEDILEITSTEYDILIIGGGITGCGIALDAASRGLRVLLLEKSDFAYGTSSRSTKLIHGGLRYLKNFEFKLVHEVGTEREIVHNNARHLVMAEKMLLPIVENGSLGKWSTSIGLRLYDMLAGVKYSERRKMLSRKDTILEEPLLKKSNLIGGGLYYEYRTDDARLTISVLKTACLHYGAKALNYAKVVDFLDEHNKVVGVIFNDAITGKNHTAKAKIVVNATGPWVDELRKINQSLTGKHIKHSKGVHLLLNKSRLPLKHAIYFDLPDGRMMFAIPRNQHTYIGTTDTFYAEQIENPTITKEDIEYIIKGMNSVLENPDLKKEDVLSMWSGVRPLIYEEGKNASELSRHDEIITSKSGLISIAGGKLTGYRSMSEKIVDICMRKLDISFPKKQSTKHIQLMGGIFIDDQELQNILTNLKIQLNNIGFGSEIAVELFHKYGTETTRILSYLKSFEASNPHRLILAELCYCIDDEMVQTLEDFFVRRSGMVYFEPEKINAELIEQCSKILVEFFNYSEQQIQNQKTILSELIQKTKWEFYFQ